MTTHREALVRSIGWSLLAVGLLPLTGSAAVWRIEAEDYKPGGQNVGYYDTTSGNTGGSSYRPGDDVDIYGYGAASNGHFVGSVAVGEWTEYELTAPQAGRYLIIGSIATDGYPGSRTVEIDGSAVTSIAVPDTGSFGTFVPVVSDSSFQLAAGTHDFRSTAVTHAHNYDYFDVVDVFDAPGRFEAENYAYFYEHTGPTPGVPDLGNGGSGGKHVGSIYPDEWLSYYVHAETAGHYWLRVRSATTFDDRSFHVDVDGATVGTIDVPNSGNFGAFVPSSVVHLDGLTPGDHELKMIADNYAQNWDLFEIFERPVAPTDPTPTTFEAEHFLTHNGGTIDTGPGSGGEHVGGITAADQWLAYDVEVAQSGYYGMRTASATDLSARQYHVEVDSTNVGTVTLADTNGWTNFEHSRGVLLGQLDPGVYEVKLVAENDGQNHDTIDVFQLQEIDTTGDSTTRIEAEDFSYFYDYQGPVPGQVHIVGGSSGQAIGSIYANEWLEYGVYVDGARQYSLTGAFAVPEQYAPDVAILSVDGLEVGQIDIGATGGFSDYVEFQMPGLLSLTEGMHIIRMTAGTSAFNFDYLDFHAVPEPASGALLLLGFVGMLLGTRRRWRP